jgi:DNA primase
VDIAEIIGEYVDLKKRGSATMGCCPFHNEKTPSFNVNREGQFFHCFGCGKGGDVFTFLMDISGMSFMEALEHLAERAGLQMPQRKGFSAESRAQAERVAAANLAAAEYFHRTLGAEEGIKGREYLESRKLNPDAIRKFRLGYAPADPAGLLAFAKKKGVSPDDLDAAGILLKSKYGGPPYARFGGRVIFPIIDPTARILGFGGRILEGEGAKYVNSPETAVYHKSRILFGLYQAKDALKRSREAIVVEGYMDVISLHQAGIKNAIAASGTSFTTDQGRIISRMARSVILLFDGDSAGLHAAARSADTLLSTDLAITVSVLPGDHDPDSFVRELGADALREHLSRAMDIWEFKLLALSKGSVGPEDRIRLAGEIADSLSLMTDEIKREVYISDLSFKLNIDPDAMRKAVAGRIRKRAAQKEEIPASIAEQVGSAQERELLACIMHYPHLARKFMEEAGSKPFSHPAMKKVAEEVFHRLVEGLDVSPGALMNALSEGPSQQVIAAAAMVHMEEALAET